MGASGDERESHAMRVLLVINEYRPDAIEDAKLLETYLLGRGIQPVKASGEHHGGAGVPDAGGYGLVVALGGDGTLLQAMRLIGYSQVPVVGISYGHLGFLTCAAPENLIHTVSDALEGRLYPSRRSVLRVTVELVDDEGNESVIEEHGLNDLALGRSARSSRGVLSFRVAVSGRHIDQLRGDGFVVSTATGSTGYALSAGGPIVTPEFGGMICVPVAPHTIMARAFLTGRDDVVELEVDEGHQGDASVFVDGRPVGEDLRLVRARCSVCPERIVLLDRDKDSFYASVSRVFYGRGGDRG